MFFVDFVIGILISVLAGLGIGSGGLLVIYLTMTKSISQLEAQGINLLFFVIAGSASLIIHIKKRKLDYKNIIVMIIFGSIGAVAGSLIASFTDGEIVKKIFGGFLLFSGIVELFSKTKKTEKMEKNS
jgi:uncharacterized membrane protein YfcA